jgi:Susd and RagB outer membrane lipoprotein
MIVNKIKTTGMCLLLLVAIGCTKNFDEINTDPNGLTDQILQNDFNYIKGNFAPMFNNVLVLNPEWKYQVQQGLQADIWSGYMATPTGFRGGTNNTTYDLVNGWNGFPWGAAYTVMSNAVKTEVLTKGKYDQFYALSLILKVEAMHRLTDTFGPIIYSQFSLSNTLPYDSQEEVYTKMFQELDIAVAELTKRADAKEPSRIASVDLSSYEGKYEQWVKFANSLRLRLAMRIVKKNPTLAKSEAEKAIAQKYGVMSLKEDTFTVVSPAYKHPINTISNSWLDIRMSADMESIMGGYNDPRLPVYFSTSTQFAGQYKGIRTGIDIASKGDHADFSGVGAAIANTNRIVWMTTAEVYFLRAEGVLRGWNMGSGTAQGFYESGITASFDQHGVSGATTYIADNVKKAKDYVDPNFPVNNGTAVNNVTVSWDGVATNEVKLQKIITQKWIANFPEGQEAWSEHRRTGYPKLFNVIKNTSGGVISSVDGVRRINFVQSEKDGNAQGLATGISKLGGPDNGATRLWWDTTGANF